MAGGDQQNVVYGTPRMCRRDWGDVTAGNQGIRIKCLPKWTESAKLSRPLRHTELDSASMAGAMRPSRCRLIFARRHEATKKRAWADRSLFPFDDAVADRKSTRLNSSH